MDWFAKQLLAWFAVNGRKDLPWQQNITPYRVWVSEIMLQQTQVTTVIDYYLRFMQRFPDVQSLAQAPLDEVLHHWTGLGYYARARNLHKAATTVVNDYAGSFPTSQAALEALPGIGRSTAGAIRAISMHQSAAILDGNVKRVLTRFHAIAGYPGNTDVANQLWTLAESHTPKKQAGAYTQAIMDLGATLCTRRRPQCSECPMQSRCAAYIAGQSEQYPHRKPKKQKPIRQARFFVTSLANKATLLEQKPLNGLWGGLWTPPEREPNCSVADYLQELALTEADLSKSHFAPVFRHTFTHFHLDIEPVYLSLKKVTEQVAEGSTQRWVHPKEVNGGNQPIGLSAPAVKLLASLEEVFDS